MQHCDRSGCGGVCGGALLHGKICLIMQRVVKTRQHAQYKPLGHVDFEFMYVQHPMAALSCACEQMNTKLACMLYECNATQRSCKHMAGHMLCAQCNKNKWALC